MSMSKAKDTLVIVESPAKAKTIEKYLGPGYTVRASVGHIRDLPKSNKKAIDIEGGFVPHYEVLAKKKDVIDELADLAKKSKDVLIATDPDREGEAIAWHLIEAANLKNPKRIVFNEITESAVKEALKNPRGIDEDLVKAQEARRVLDRLFGYDLSALIWKKVRYGLSAGRVQSPALRILMEREREIEGFVPEKFWVLEADLKEKGAKEPITFTCKEEPRDEKEADRIEKEGTKGSWYIKDISQSQQKRSPRAPFTTSTLQQTASTRLGFSPSRTMSLAQRLYEAGHITYMRTDSTNLSQEAAAKMRGQIEKEYGKEYVQPRTFKTKSKSAQEAHEAIRPTNPTRSEAGRNADEKKLYALIYARALASQMADAQLMRTQVVANVADDPIPDFSVNGSRIIFYGWLKADPDANQNDVILPKFAKGDTLTLDELRKIEKETQPPGRYTEAGLVKELEKRGIGRPSTYASIIKTIQDRGYVDKEGKTLFPTDTGEVVSSFLEKHFTNYISDTFTAEMEDTLDTIAEGKKKYEKTLSEFYRPFTKAVKSKEDIEKLTTLGDAPEEFTCPECGSGMVIKLGKTGKFMSCNRFPDCTGSRTIEGKEIQPPKEIGQMCPKCGEKHGGKLVQKEGRYGVFISCSRYPKCKFVKEDEEEAAKKRTGVPCPECADGEITQRNGRFGEFFSCNNYPDCKYAINARPTGKKCPECGALMMEGTKTIPERCSDKTCPMHRPDKLKK